MPAMWGLFPGSGMECLHAALALDVRQMRQLGRLQACAPHRKGL